MKEPKQLSQEEINEIEVIYEVVSQIKTHRNKKQQKETIKTTLQNSY